MPTPDWLFWAHRLAHIAEYATLGILTLRAYAHGQISVRVNRILYLAGLMFLAGAFDEWHQSFVPGRSSELMDVVFDTICASVGMLVTNLIVRRLRDRELNAAFDAKNRDWSRPA